MPIEKRFWEAAPSQVRTTNEVMIQFSSKTVNKRPVHIYEMKVFLDTWNNNGIKCLMCHGLGFMWVNKADRVQGYIGDCKDEVDQIETGCSLIIRLSITIWVEVTAATEFLHRT